MSEDQFVEIIGYLRVMTVCLGTILAFVAVRWRNER